MERSTNICFRDPLKRTAHQFPLRCANYVYPFMQAIPPCTAKRKGHGTRETRLGGSIYVHRSDVMLKCKIDVLQVATDLIAQSHDISNLKQHA